jgi:hypothetical protein
MQREEKNKQPKEKLRKEVSLDLSTKHVNLKKLACTGE